MPAAHPVEFRRRTVALARSKEKPVAQLAVDLGVSESCLRRWMKIADVDEGVQEGVTSDERAEPVRLRRENRVRAGDLRMDRGLVQPETPPLRHRRRLTARFREPCARLSVETVVRRAGLSTMTRVLVPGRRPRLPLTFSSGGNGRAP